MPAKWDDDIEDDNGSVLLVINVTNSSEGPIGQRAFNEFDN